MLQPRSSSTVKRQVFLSLGLLLVVVAILAASFFNSKVRSAKLQAIVFSPPRALQAFQLEHASFSQANLLHHWTFLFFGFTHCSEVCPTTLTELKEVYQNLQASQPDLQVIFITLDPERDRKTRLEHYVTAFHKNFVGLGGTTAELQKLEQQFGVIAEHDAPGSSSLNHTSSIFLINPEGQWIAVFPHGLRAKQIQDDFQTILEQSAHA